MSGPSTEFGPGWWAFVAFFVLALALWLLMRNMFGRLRRMNLAERDRLEAERRQGAEHRQAEERRASPAGGDPEVAVDPTAGADPTAGRGHGTTARDADAPAPTDD